MIRTTNPRTLPQIASGEIQHGLAVLRKNIQGSVSDRDAYGKWLFQHPGMDDTVFERVWNLEGMEDEDRDELLRFAPSLPIVFLRSSLKDASANLKAAAARRTEVVADPELRRILLDSDTSTVIMYVGFQLEGEEFVEFVRTRSHHGAAMVTVLEAARPEKLALLTHQDLSGLLANDDPTVRRDALLLLTRLGEVGDGVEAPVAPARRR